MKKLNLSKQTIEILNSNGNFGGAGTVLEPASDFVGNRTHCKCAPETEGKCMNTVATCDCVLVTFKCIVKTSECIGGPTWMATCESPCETTYTLTQWYCAEDAIIK